MSAAGTADVEGNEVVVRVLDGAGAELAAVVVDVRCKRGCPGTFATELSFFVERREPGTIAVSGETADGPRYIWWNFVSARKERIEQAKADWAAGRFAPVPGETEFIPLPE